MHSSGLPTTVSALLKLGAFDMGGGAWTTVRGRCGGELMLVGSEAEWACLLIGRAMGSLYGLGLDRIETEDERDTGKQLAASGNSGLLESVIGLEILSVLIVLFELDRLKFVLRFRCYYLVIGVAWTRSESSSSRVRPLRCTCTVDVR